MLARSLSPLILLDLDQIERVHLAVALADRARELRRDGRALPPRLERLAADLLAGCDGGRDAQARRRAAAAARSARYRARKRAERAAAASGTAGADTG
jgi:hypothetical protein